MFITCHNWLVAEARKELNTLPVAQVSEFINSTVYWNACFVLTHRLFRLRPPRSQANLIGIVSELLGAASSRRAADVAGLVSGVAGKIMRDASVPLVAKLRLYDSIYHMFWLSDSTFFGLAPVNSAVVQPLSDFLQETQTADEQYRAVDRTDRSPRFGYLLNFTSLSPVAAGVTLFLSMISGHAVAFPDHEILVYTFRDSETDAFAAALKKSGAIDRRLKIIQNDDGLTSVRDLIRGDDLDYFITDTATGVATYLFESRCAPRQIYAYMAFYCWRIRNIDLVYGFTIPWRDWMGFESDTYLMGPVALESSRSLREVSPAELAAVRAPFPPNYKIFGYFGRFIKITEEYISIIERILKKNPDSIFFAAGYGDSSIFDGIMESPVAERCRISRVPVDVSLYGRIIDVMLDSFPFAGGNILREMQFLGKPVVALRTPIMGTHYDNTIDPRLIAGTVDEYEALASRLIREDAFYRECCERAHQFGERATDIKTENGELIRSIMAALPPPG